MDKGDYVRTENGRITKIKAICEQKWEEPECIYSRVLCEDNEIYEYPKHIKSSPNIIDLIEVGDYVNGKEVFTLIDNQEPKLVATEGGCLNNKEIKSIVTKEMYSSMEYKIGE